MKEHKIYCGDCLEILPKLPRAKMIFADPPDNLGMKYEGFKDCIPRYDEWFARVVRAGCREADVFWFSCSHRYISDVWPIAFDEIRNVRLFIWRFTFGQHNRNDCGIGYRPLFRIWNLELWNDESRFYPDAIRTESQRQRNKDKRANPAGRVPDDVWEFPRICGNFPERRKWFPNQHPEALMERIIKFSTKEGDLVIDMFGGSGTTMRVCQRLNRPCIAIEISPYYCERISKETGVGVIK